MSKKAISGLLKYAAAIVLCGTWTASHICSQDLAEASQKEILLTLTDGFFLPGILLVFIGLLVFVSNNGAFHGIGYVLHVTIHALIPGGRYNMEKYGDYIARKEEKPITGYGFLFIVGGLFMLIGIVFFVLFKCT